MDDLASRVTTLQRLSRRDMELLRLRGEGLSTGEIAARLASGQRDVLLQLAQIYDTLWLTHLPRAERIETLTSLYSTIAYLESNDLLPAADAAIPAARIAPPQAAVIAVIADEQGLLASRTAHETLVQEDARATATPDAMQGQAAPQTRESARPNAASTTGTTSAEPLLVPADRDASLVRLALISTAIIVVVVVAVALLFVNGGASKADTPSSDTPATPTEALATTTATSKKLALSASPESSATRPPATATATATPQPTHTPTPSPTPLPPTATPIPPTPGPTVLYQSNWAASMADWTASGNWSVQDGILIYTGGQGSGVIYSPFQPVGGQVYVVEAEVQIDNPNAAGAVTGFAIEDVNARGGNPLRVATYWVPDTEWHTYRLTVEGEMATLTVDGQFAGQIIDATYANAGRVGIYTNASRLQARRFTVTDRP